MIFRAVWPLLEDGTPYRDLIRTASAEVPMLAARSHVRVVAPGRFSIAPSSDVPGSGRTTETVLVFEAPAAAIARRDYWKVAG